ncbi:MAG: phasin family protein [Novosphingobium sp.]|nr:phasin family protein [Novosphingobium sp.]
MVEKTEIEAEVAAEKAYAAAAEAPHIQPVPAKPTPVEPAAPEPAAAIAPEVVFPSKATRVPKPKAEAPAVVAKPAAKPAPAPIKKPTPRAALSTSSALKAPAASAARRVPVKKTFKKAALAKPVVQAPLPLKAPKTKITPQAKAAAPTIAAPKTVFQQLKDKTMETTEFTTKLKSAVGEVQTKAKEALGKGAATFGEYSEFSKGNVEAVVASGKILATGMQALGTTLVADGKTAFETLTAEVKELAAVKSPTDFFKLQAAFLRRNFETVVANTSKNSETIVKLANEAAAPISARVSLAVAKVKKAA